MHTSMNIHIELKREIHVGGIRKNEGSTVLVTASVSFMDKREKDLEDCFSAIKNYVDSFNKHADDAFPILPNDDHILREHCADYIA